MTLSVPRVGLVEPRVLAAKMEFLDSSFATGMLGCWLASILVASAIFSINDDLPIMLWSSVVGCVCALGYWGRLHIPKRTVAGYAERYADCMIVLVAVLGSLWGIGALYYLSLNAFPSTLDVLSVIAVMTGVTTAATGLFSCSRRVVVTFLLTLALPIWGYFLWNNHPVGAPLRWGIPLYLGMLMIFAHQSALATERAINLRFENQDLLLRLQQETTRASTARNEAEKANREKSVTLASASHDLRQPLHALSLFLIALGRTDLTDKQRVLLDHIEASSSAAQEMLHTLLDYSKLDSGSIRPKPRDFPMQALLYKLERVFAPDAEAQNLVYRSRDTTLWAYADPNLVEQILRNLISNAIRYTARGGLLVVCRRRQGKLVCEVWDTGIGIPELLHREIFREFCQLNNPEQDRRKGVGLGLAIVTRLAQTMDVPIGLSSRLGRGSVFRLTLPLGMASAQEAPVLPQQSRTSESLAGLRVLVIDDDENVLKGMAALLEAWNCLCRTTDSGSGAVDFVAGDFKPDLIVADYRLRRKLTGIEVIRQVREAVGKSVPAIIITGETDPDRFREIEGSGIDVLHKPVDEIVFRSTIARVLARNDLSPT